MKLPHKFYQPNRLVIKQIAARIALLGFIITLGLSGLSLFQHRSMVTLAQSTGDSIKIKTVTPTPAATSRPATEPPSPAAEAMVWQARLIDVVPNATLGGGAIVRVTVQDRPGEPIVLQHEDMTLNNTAGSKAEYGPFAAEFAPVPGGQWLVSVPALNVSLAIQTDFSGLFVIEFAQIPASQATAIALTFATPTPAGGTLWKGEVVRQTEGPSVAGALLRVKVAGQSNLPVDLATVSEVIGHGVTGNKPDDLAADELEFAGLTPGSYTIIPHGLNLEFTLELTKNTTVYVEFNPIPIPTATFTPTPQPPTSTTAPTATPTPSPTPITHWAGLMTQSTNRGAYTGQTQSTIIVRVEDQIGQVVTLTGNRIPEPLRCSTNSLHYCRFESLPAGVFTLTPANLDAQYSLFVDGTDRAEVTFSRVSGDRATNSPITGRGAVPQKIQRGIGVVTATPTPSATPLPSPTPRPPTATSRAIRATSTPAPSPTLTASPTPAMAWNGTIAEQYSRPGQMIVVRAPINNHPVTLTSGPWQLEGQTGSKPEQGDFAVEFSGLAPGTYTIDLVGLGQATVNLETNRFILVQFSFGPAPTPTPTPQPGWTAATLSNTGRPGDNGRSSILTIEIGGVNNLPVVVRTDGFETECTTGTKPELGDGVCQIGGLGPATYQIQPQGLPVSHTVTLDGQGAARVAFWQR